LFVFRLVFDPSLPFPPTPKYKDGLLPPPSVACEDFPSAHYQTSKTLEHTYQTLLKLDRTTRNLKTFTMTDMTFTLVFRPALNTTMKSMKEQPRDGAGNGPGSVAFKSPVPSRPFGRRSQPRDGAGK
jgi:hypothetical protein